MALKVEPVPKSWAEMLAEFCREVAVLVLVFVPLELYRQPTIQPGIVKLAILGSAILLVIGMLVESVRK